jgi:hypothetical protein
MFYNVEVIMTNGEKRKVNVDAPNRDTAILRAGQADFFGSSEHYDTVWCVHPWLEEEDSE